MWDEMKQVLQGSEQNPRRLKGQVQVILIGVVESSLNRDELQEL